jgi:hypothetical protein
MRSPDPDAPGYAAERKEQESLLDPPEKPGPRDPAYTEVQTALASCLARSIARRRQNRGPKR